MAKRTSRNRCLVSVAAGALAVLLFTAGSEAQQPDASAPSQVTDSVLIHLCGKHFSQVFSQAGVPDDMKVHRANNPKYDEVFFDYRAKGYGFEVNDKIITTVFFFSGWTSPIHGIRIGSSREEVERILGRPVTVDKDKNGIVTDYGYEVKGFEFYANFDKDGKVWRVEVVEMSY